MGANLAFYAFLLRAAVRNLWRVPRRTAIVISTLAAAVACLILFSAFYSGVKARFRSNIIRSYYGHFHVVKKGFEENKSSRPFDYSITETDLLRKKIESGLPPMAMFGRRQEFFGLLSRGELTISAKGVSSDPAEEAKFLNVVKMVEGKHLADSDDNAIVLGEGLARQLGVKVGDPLTVLVSTSRGSLNARDLEVAGFFRTGVKEFDDLLYFVKNELAFDLLQIKGGSSVFVSFDTDDEMSIAPAFKALLAKDFPDLELKHWRDVLGEYFDNTIGWLDDIFLVVRVIIVAMALLGIINIFMINVFERIGEIATLRAIGTQKKEVIFMLLIEFVLQGVLGGLFGILVAQGLISSILRNGIEMPPPAGLSTVFVVMMQMNWGAALLIALIVTCVAAVAGLFPALRVNRIPLARALGANV